MKKFIMVLGFLLLTGGVAVAQNITFEWDPHEQAAELAGFKLYQTKQCGQYGTAPVATFTGGYLVTGSIPLPTGTGKHCWVLTAYIVADGVDVESAYSNEVSSVVKPKPPKLNRATQVALASVKGVVKAAGLVAGLFQKDDDLNLRIKK